MLSEGKFPITQAKHNSNMNNLNKKHNLLLLAIVMLAMDFSIVQAQRVENVRAVVQGKTVVVTYDLVGTAMGKNVSVKLYYSSDGGRTYVGPLFSVTGDVGEKVSSGLNKKIVWDALKHEEWLLAESAVFRIELEFIGIGDDRNVTDKTYSVGDVVPVYSLSPIFSRPDFKSPETYKVPFDELVTILKKENNNYYYVECNHHKGYLNSLFIKDGVAKRYNIDGLSKPIKIYVSKKNDLPANLVMEKPSFTEPSGNNFLDAEETGELILTLENTGRGDAFGVIVKLIPETNISGIMFVAPPPIAFMPAGKKETITIPISASENVASKQIRLKIDVTEANGFDVDSPTYIIFNARALVPPEFIIADIGINDQSGNGQIEPREIVEIIARIQNRGRGDAHNVSATVEVGQNVFLTPDSKTQFSLGNLSPGTFKDVSFSVFTNTQATGVPVFLIVKEARARYDRKLPLELTFNKAQKRATELVLEGKETLSRENERVAGLSVDIDVSIPKTKLRNPDAVAVIIGIAHYKNPDVPSVDYATRGAAVMKEYLVNAFGFDEHRIIYATDENASLSDFKRIFEEQLRNWIRAGKSDVFIYYNGHGAPDLETKGAFFVPYDCNPTFSSTGYPVKEFYNRLAKLPANSVTIVLDACFSGSTPRGMLLKQVSPVFISVDNPVFTIENGLLFSSSNGEQLSNWYPEKRHSLFTYYFLKGLRGEADHDGDRQVTAEEMERYLLHHIPDQARYLNNREQTPQVKGREKNRVLVKY